MKLSDEKIDSIAQDVEMGMNIYLHRKTGETIAITGRPDKSRRLHSLTIRFLPIHLKDFEQYIDASILARGCSYFEGGYD